MSYKIMELDPLMQPFARDIDLRMERYAGKKKELLKDNLALNNFANAHAYFGFHKIENGWVYREWAPAADAMYLTGDFNNWDINACPMNKLGDGVFEVILEGENAPKVGQRLQAIVHHNGEILRRIPLYATRVVQDPQTILWCAELEDTFAPFPWTDQGFKPDKTPLIYECHIGMAQEKYGVGSYREFKENTLPRIQAAGYNTIQIMAIMEHPYYGSFGYQVSNFFAAASRYGYSEELKDLINTAHSMGIAVLLDVVHSHAVKNTSEGINEFDGTVYQFFHDGPKGHHSAWDTKLFNYGKGQVIHFLLSNLKYWMEVFHFDGFRFDGVTSMLYWDHGLGTSFMSYDKYFSMNTDLDAVTYLQLANELIHQINPNAITIAEDMSGMPGMCLPIRQGGIGFDYRLSMGMPDLWIRTIKEQTDEMWDLGKLWYELNSRRPGEKNVGYCESHDQALVGDKTLMFRLCDQQMYWCMGANDRDMTIDRGMALHKMIRLLTATLGGEGYLTFMGNEFGHPEWIDFPREGNGWSYHYCRLQWSLADDPYLKYQFLLDFEKDMVTRIKSARVLQGKDVQLMLDNEAKTLVYKKGGCVFAYNFHPTDSYDGCLLTMPEQGEYQVIMSTDDYCYGGQGRIWHQSYRTQGKKPAIRMYLPSRTAVILKKK